MCVLKGSPCEEIKKRGMVTRQEGIIYMGASMLGDLPIFGVCMNTSVLVSKDYLEMAIFIARKTNSPYAVRTFSFVLGPLFLASSQRKSI